MATSGGLRINFSTILRCMRVSTTTVLHLQIWTPQSTSLRYSKGSSRIRTLARATRNSRNGRKTSLARHDSISSAYRRRAMNSSPLAWTVSRMFVPFLLPFPFAHMSLESRRQDRLSSEQTETETLNPNASSAITPRPDHEEVPGIVRFGHLSRNRRRSSRRRRTRSESRLS